MDTEREWPGGSPEPGIARPGLADDLAQLGLSSGVIEALAPAMESTRLVVYEPGVTLYNEDAEIEALYVIRRGKVKLLSYLGDGRARIVRLHSRAAIIGLNGLLGQRHEHTAIAVDEVEVYQMPLDLLKPIREEDPAAYSHLLEQWNQYLSCADTWITDFSTGPIRGRVARLIRFLADLDDRTGPREVTLLTGEEMSEVLGVTPESVSRVIAEFKRRDILTAVADGERYLCDLEALGEESHG